MATNDRPSIIVHGFSRKLGKIDPDTGQPKVVDFVSYSPSHAAMFQTTIERIDMLRPRVRAYGDEQGGEKDAFIEFRWSLIEPAYKAWLEGKEMPLNGTPLSAWPLIEEDWATVLIKVGIRTIEDLAQVTDANLTRIQLPNVRALRDQAKTYIDRVGSMAAAEKLEAQENTIKVMSERMAALEEMLAEKNAKPARASKEAA